MTSAVRSGMDQVHGPKLQKDLAAREKLRKMGPFISFLVSFDSLAPQATATPSSVLRLAGSGRRGITLVYKSSGGN